MYRFEDNGKRRVALRYDQTVPLARVIATKGNELALPFKRYQIQPVWRAENTQKGRFREFLQCDADIVGVNSPLSDSEIIQVAISSMQALCFGNFKVLINDRENLQFKTGGIELTPDKNIKAVRVIDKLKKIGRDGVLAELQTNGFSEQESNEIMQTVQETKPTKRLEEVFECLRNAGISESSYEFSPTLARGLDYYTGLIIEVEVEGYSAGSVLGGGRYDKLIGMFAGRDIPAVGFAFGFDRIIEALEQFDLFPKEMNKTQVLVTIFSPDYKDKSVETASRLRSKNINTELYLDENTPLEKQLKYANQKQIPYVVIVGQEEINSNKVTLKNMQKREQEMITVDELILSLRA